MRITDECIMCGTCMDICPVEAIIEGIGKMEIDEDICIGCSACAEACPIEVIEIANEINSQNISSCERSRAKDAFAKAILWGGFAAAKFAICTLAVEVGLIDANTANYLSKYISKLSHKEKQRLWQVYEESGSIGAIFSNL